MKFKALPPAGKAIEPDWLDDAALPTTRALLGQFLCRRLSDDTVVRWPICEIEAYDGREDKACHASRGKTPRNSVMFAPAGVWYVYLCYGVHELLNIVVGPRDYPAAALIRGAGGIYGPGRVTKALQIGRHLNKRTSTETTGLWIESSGKRLADAFVEATPRIGIDSVVPEWRDKPYRFWVSPKHYSRIFKDAALGQS